MPSRSKTRSSEGALSHAIKAALTANQCWCLRLQSGAIPLVSKGATRYMRSGEPGCPDLIIMYPEIKNSRRYVIGFAEIKTATGKLSKDQLAWHDKAAAKGIRVATLRSIGEALGVLAGWQARNLERSA